MKKVALFFALLATSSVHASLPMPCLSLPSVSAPIYSGNFVVGVTGLFWQPSVDQFDYVQIFHPADTDAEGNIHPFALQDADLRYDWGYRINIGYLFPCTSNELSFTYTDYRHHQRDFIIAQPGDALNSTIGSLAVTAGVTVGSVTLASISIPSIEIDASTTSPAASISLTVPGQDVDIEDVVIFPQMFFVFPTAPTIANATAQIDNHVIDIDLQQHMCWGCGSDFHLIGGLRFADVDQNLTANFFGNITSLLPPTARGVAFDPINFSDGEITVNSETAAATVVASDTSIGIQLDVNLVANFREIIREKSEFNGIGPRLGLGGTYQLGKGFGLVADLSSALLIGNVKNDYNDRFVIDVSGTAVATVINTATTITGTATLDGAGETIVDATPIAFQGNLVGPTVEAATTEERLHFRNNDNVRVVPNIDVKLGLSYTACLDCTRSKFTVEAGYLASHYFNAIDRVRPTENHPNIVTVLDTSFSGPYVSVNFTL